MKIAGSSLVLESTHAQTEKYSKTESVQYWDQRGQVTFTSQSDSLNISQQAQLFYQKDKGMEGPLAGNEDQILTGTGGNPATRKISVDGYGDTESYLNREDQHKILLLQNFIEAITGKKFKFILLDQKNLIHGQDAGITDLHRHGAGDSAQGAGVPAVQLQGWGFRYDAYERYEEAEKTTFNAQGIVRTADGKEISIEVSLSMSRSFISENQIGIKAGDALKDPLVINFDGKAAQLTQRKYAFDLDSDGLTENIAFVQPGSGFLALDKNGDQRINDGSELFGANTGDGFAELAAYDQDGNGWIDENDPIYHQLRIWTKDESGQDRLLALGQQGIGAIYLGRTETAFDLKDSENALQGRVHSTGIYLKENGGAGIIQQVDLAV